jgi:hypothetical protein
MGEFSRQVTKQAAETLREMFGREPLPWENPLLELMGYLLGDGFGEVWPLPDVLISSQQWLDWHYLGLMKPERLIAATSIVLETERRKLPQDLEAMRTWAASLLLSALDQLELM